MQKRVPGVVLQVDVVFNRRLVGIASDQQLHVPCELTQRFPTSTEDETIGLSRNSD
jgi:hypothetical protein